MGGPQSLNNGNVALQFNKHPEFHFCVNKLCMAKADFKLQVHSYLFLSAYTHNPLKESESL